MKTTISEQQLEFLKNNCSNTIKNLLLLHDGNSQSDEFIKNHNALLELPIISYWKKNSPTEISHTITKILGSSDSCFENSFGKLLFFGLSINDILTNNLLQTYISFISKSTNNNIFDSLARYVVAGYLFAADCSNEVVKKIVTNRIDTLYNFITTSPIKYHIYISASDSKLPSKYKSKKLVNPLLYERNEIVLPLIYDIFIFNYIYNKISQDYKTKIDKIIDYIANTKYQSLDYGYGIIKFLHNTYHFMGWSAHLPLYNKNLSSNYFRKGLIFRMAIFSKFKNRDIQLWLKETLIKLEEFKLDKFQYCFSSELLPETRNSYFMNGRHTGLNENRKQKIGKIVESTYYAYLAGKK